LRGVRQRALDGSIVCISGADPLNLVGGLLAGERVPRLAGSRVLYRDGVPVAKRVAGEIVLLDTADPALQRLARDRLLRDQVRTPSSAAASSSPEEE